MKRIRMWFLFACFLPAVSGIAADALYSAAIALAEKLFLDWNDRKAGYASLFILIFAVLLFLVARTWVMYVRNIKQVSKFKRNRKTPGFPYKSYAGQAMDEYVSFWNDDMDSYDAEYYDAVKGVMKNIAAVILTAFCLLAIEWRLFLVITAAAVLALGVGVLFGRSSKDRFCMSLQKMIFSGFTALLTILGLLYTAVKMIHGILSLGCAIFLVLLVNEAARNVSALFEETNKDAVEILLKKRAPEQNIDLFKEWYEREDEMTGEDRPFSFRQDIICTKLVVSFGEKATGRPFDLCLVYGKKYLLTGKPGTGKTTLVNSLTGTYKDYGGRILYDDVEVRHISEKELYEGTAVIRQDLSLLNDSIYRNICLDKKYSQEEVTHAVEAAGMSGLIEKLPQGLNTKLTDHGKELPAGGGQRIAIARAMIRRPRLLAADDISAGLPKKVARKIEDTLLTLDTTVIVVSQKEHQSEKKGYDAMIEMPQGRLVYFPCIERV